MKQIITEQDLLDAGYASGSMIGEMLARVDAHEENGVSDAKYLMKLLKREFSAPPLKLAMREKPAAFAEAIEGVTKDEKKNVEKVRKQMRDLLKVPIIQRGAVMPDACPAGMAPAVIPVGGAIAVENAIIPSAHSADVCCSMFATFYEARTEVKEEINALATATRFGPGGRHFDDLVHHPVLDEEVWENRFLKGLWERARIHLADQGDGNHFAYVGEVELSAAQITVLRRAGHVDFAQQLSGGDDEEAGLKKYRVLVTHHGSRGLGAHLYKRGQTAAIKQTGRIAERIPKAAVWLDARSDEGQAYWEALQYVGRWTKANHEAIHARFLERIGGEAVAQIGNEHNFVWKRGETFLHGKGATPAWKDAEGRPLLGLIPLNMAEPILMVLGSDNEEFLSFAPHGAGRNMSRTAMKRLYPSAESKALAIEEGTRGLDVRWFCGGPDLSETPIAYKNAEQVRAQIEQFGLAEVVAEIKPLGCIMAGDTGPNRWRRLKEEALTPKQKRQIQHRAERRRIKQELGGEW
jgi:tRNA-splicing ligase RtcB